MFGSIPRLVAGALALIAAAAIPAASAQEFPTRAVRVLAGSPGTLMDVAARIVARRLGERWNQAVIVENRGGAGFTIGTAAAAHAAPDGHTLVMSDRTALAAAPHLYKALAYDPMRDFAPIAMVAVTPLVMIAHPSLPASTLAEFVEYAKAQEAVDFATSGMSTTSHVAAEMLKLATGINPVYVHYKGSPDAQRAVLSGEPKVGFTAATSVGLIAAGKLKAFAVTSHTRLSAAPSIPTVAEAGFPGSELEYWVGVLAPAGTPPALVSRLNREITEIVRSAEMRDALSAQGAEAITGTPQEFAARIRSDYAKVKAQFERMNLQPE